jgi:hypothetical protein
LKEDTGNKSNGKNSSQLKQITLFIPEVKTGLPSIYIIALHEKTKFKTINLQIITKYIIKEAYCCPLFDYIVIFCMTPMNVIGCCLFIH